MQKLDFKKIRIATAVLIVLYLLTPVEYYEFKIKNLIHLLFWIGFPFYITLFLPEKRPKLLTVFLVFGLVSYLLSSLFFVVGFSICGWTDGGTYYVNKQDKSLKIISRRFGCYGTDEDHLLFEQRQITAHLKWVTEYKEKVDLNIWQSVNKL